MRKFRIGACILMLICLSFSLTACSVTDVFDSIVSDTADNTEEETKAKSEVEVKNVDDTIAVPAFEMDLSGSVPLTAGTEYTISCPAESTDGGTITYQWYVNNVNSNGGGTAIKGATSDSYTVTTEETGSTFYYVVACNNHDSSYNSATSSTFEIVTYASGSWKVDEIGRRYVSDDGSYPSNVWLQIDDDIYCFNESGYCVTGWYVVDVLYYYFDEDGKLLRNGTTPDGCTTDENGLLKSGTPVIG